MDATTYKMERKWELKSTKYQTYRSTERFEWQMVPRTSPGTVRREKVAPFWGHFGRKCRPEGRSWDQEGAKLGPKIEKMRWEKASENRCCKSVENHVKIVRKLWPNAWENRQVYIAFRKRHERQKTLENTCIFKIFACRSWYKSTKNNATNIVKIMLQKKNV